MKKEMLINVLQPEECRIAIIENGLLEELYVERTSQESYVGNVYKGRIVNIEPSIQAAFVDFGIGRNGFLHVSDVDPAYYKHLMSRSQSGFGGSPRHAEEFDEEPPRRHRRDEPPRDQRRAERHFEEPRDFEPRREEVVDEPAFEPPVFQHDDDPYAALAGDFENPTVTEKLESNEKADGDCRRSSRLSGRRRHAEETDEGHRDVIEEPAPPVRQTPPPLPKREESSSFGAGIDIWGDEPPPPYMPSAERRTHDDEFDEPSGGGS